MPENDTKLEADQRITEAKIQQNYDRITQRLENEANLVEVYNNMMCEQCVARLSIIYGRSVSECYLQIIKIPSRSRHIKLVFQMMASLLFWWLASTFLPKSWPDITINNDGLSISDE